MQRIRSNLALILGAFTALVLALSAGPGCTSTGVGETGYDTDDTDTGGQANCVTPAVQACDGSALAALVTVTPPLSCDGTSPSGCSGGIAALCSVDLSNASLMNAAFAETESDQPSTAVRPDSGVLAVDDTDIHMLDFNCTDAVTEAGCIFTRVYTDVNMGTLICETGFQYTATVN